MGNAAGGELPFSGHLVQGLSGEEVDVSDGSAVLLNVYDLSEDWLRTNNVFVDVLQIGGAFHTGVEVFGREWSYGSEGVSYILPRCHDVHIYRQSVPMGVTLSSQAEVQQMIEQEIAPRWRGENYDLLRRNCCNFSDALCNNLCGESIPAWVNRFPKLASVASKSLNKVMNFGNAVGGSLGSTSGTYSHREATWQQPSPPNLRRATSGDSLYSEDSASTSSTASFTESDCASEVVSPRQLQPIAAPSSPTRESSILSFDLAAAGAEEFNFIRALSRTGFGLRIPAPRYSIEPLALG